MEVTDKRNIAIDVAKCMAILLMVLGHTGMPYYFTKVFYLFHMPLFFFCSGFCFKEKYFTDAVRFIKRKVKRIYWPYIKWGVIFLALHNVFMSLNIYHPEFGYGGRTEVWFELKDYVYHLLSILTRMEGEETLLGSFWFLKVLFVSSIFSYFMLKYIKSRYLAAAIMLFLAIFAATTFWPEGYFKIGKREFLASFFFIMGFIMRNFDFDRKLWTVIPAVAILFITACFPKMSMLSVRSYFVVPYAVLGCLGIYMMLVVSHKIAKRSSKLTDCMVYIGNATLDILIWHFLFLKLGNLIVLHIEGLPIKYLSCFPVIVLDDTLAHDYTPYWPLYFAIGVIGPLSIVYFKEKLQIKERMAQLVTKYRRA